MSDLSSGPLDLLDQKGAVTELRTVSYGGGVQSTALLVLAAQGRIDFPTFIFANVGPDSEHPATLTYLDEVAHPYAKAHGIRLVETRRVRRDGQDETVRSRIMRPDRKSQVIPVRSSADGPPMSRSCTVDFKINAIGKWLKTNGASETNKATVAIGISLDEIHRANRKPRPYEDIVYPLLDLPRGTGIGAPVSRDGCMTIILGAGLPVPPKSSCYFCPFHSLNEWIRIRRDEPDLFADAELIEATISAKAGSPRYLTRFGVPLAAAVPEGHDLLPFGDDTDADCESGMCMT